MDKKFIRIEPVKGRLVRVPETGREVAEPMKVQATSFGGAALLRAMCARLKTTRCRNEHQL